MGATLLARERFLHAAEAEVARTEAEVKVACKDARGIRSRDDCLANRPDLLRLDQLIRDRGRLQIQLAQAQEDYRHAAETKLSEKIRAVPFNAPAGLEGGIERLRLLHRDVKSATDAQSFLIDDRLDEADKVKNTARINANRTRWIPLHGLWETSRTRACEVGCRDSDWQEYVGSVEEALHRREQELRDLRREHDNKLRLDAETELRPLKARVDSAHAALSEADAASSHQPGIDRYVASQIEAFVAEQTRYKRAVYEAAVRAAQEIRRSCMEQFRWRLDTDFLAARSAEFAPAGHPLHRELEEAKTNFIREWGS